MTKINFDSEEFDREEFLKSLGQHIRSHRINQGISASELAKRMNLERSHIARIEAGNTNPTATTLIRICKALKINLSKFFEGFPFE